MKIQWKSSGRSHGAQRVLPKFCSKLVRGFPTAVEFPSQSEFELTRDSGGLRTCPQLSVSGRDEDH